MVQCSLDSFRVLSLNFGGKWKKLAEKRSPEIPTFRMYAHLRQNFLEQNNRFSQRSQLWQSLPPTSLISIWISIGINCIGISISIDFTGISTGISIRINWIEYDRFWQKTQLSSHHYSYEIHILTPMHWSRYKRFSQLSQLFSPPSLMGFHCATWIINVGRIQTIKTIKTSNANNRNDRNKQ